MQNVILKQDFSEAIEHGMYVSNMAYEIGKEIGLQEEKLQDLAIAGVLHDIGKLKLLDETDKDNMVIEQLRYVRMHSKLSYEILKDSEYSDFVLESILYHHENFDGTGYPSNLSGEDIPIGARILRVCDVFIALVSNRAYRKAFDKNTAVTMMMEEVKNFDMKIFLAFLNVINGIDINTAIFNRQLNKKDIVEIQEEIMALSKKPVTGMKEILPKEMKIRDYVMNVIKETYAAFGFTSIETPCMENIANLSNKQGGENEKLIFKVLKRGEKLDIDNAKEENDLIDFGMRYDLTVPLVRFYSNNENNLPSPFKALQMGNVWRADRPQRGRYRQFMQCDIDILGEPSNLAEIELILATTTTLGKLNFKNFQIRINERRILKAMAAYSGFSEDAYDLVFIILDKMDKIGLNGVEDELLKADFTPESVQKYLGLFKGIEESANGLEYLRDELKGFLEEEVAASLTEIIDSVKATKSSDFEIVFDPTLVRGMSYYTGTIFEIAIPEFGGSCGGGGRYDKMVGKFTGKDVPACGFSIGFERIVLLLLESGFEVPTEGKKVAYLIEKGVKGDRLCDIIAMAQEARKNGDQVLVARMNKNKKFQKEQLMNEGYDDFKDFYKEELK